MSFHGWTGSGKNYLAKMIARALYKKEMHSKFVHLYVATLHFPHPEETEKYKVWDILRYFVNKIFHILGTITNLDFRQFNPL
jgi:recombinational DNA repair protein (RecF pathway)